MSTNVDDLLRKLRESAPRDPLYVQAATVIEDLRRARQPKRGVDVSRMKQEHIDKFWSQVDRSGGPDACWTWMGRCNTDGYGHCWIPGRRADVRAHRVACALVGKEQRPGLEADHTCKNRGCCNPAHIEFVTPKENKSRSTAPHAKNAMKTHCSKGHELAGSNLAIVASRKKNGKYFATRVCLTCYPRNWYNAVEKRGPPPGYETRRVKEWRGPFTPPQ